MKNLQKRLKILFCLIISAVMIFTCALAGCGESETPPEGGDTVQQPEQQKPEQQKPEQQKPEQQKPEEQKPEEQKPEAFTVVYRSGYTPEKFSGVTNEITELGAGVHLVTNKLKKTNGQDVVVYAIEVDLKEANIVAGTKDNAAADFSYAKAAPYAMAQAWEKETGGHVYMSLNADFFGAQCVNAFVKDGVIIKDGHQDKGDYDYALRDENGNPTGENGAADVPASAPMLFGVKGTTAQIAPIQQYTGDPTTAAVKEPLIKAKLSYTVKSGSDVLDVKVNAAPDSGYITFRTAGKSAAQKKGYAVKIDTSKGMSGLTVLEDAQEVKASTEYEAGEGYGWLQSTSTVGSGIKKYLSSLKAGDKVNISVTSPDGTWDGYETILGCRHALVVGDKIADTVKKEYSNGAQSPEVPRSAVGVKPNGNVVIFAVESLWYGGSKTDAVRVETDTHGMNLPELAEFAYYYGCTQAANFDGGGSTQLVVRGEKEETGRVVVRSSDTGSTELMNTRVVMNSILVTSRKEG